MTTARGIAQRICDVARCGRITHGFSSHCSLHADQLYRHGAVGKAGVRETDYRTYNHWAAEGLARYRQTKATEAALNLADEVLNFRAVHQYKFHRELERMVALMRDDQVTASDILHRICLHVAFVTAHPGRFTGGPRVERLALARCVMRLCPLRRYGRRWLVRSLVLLADIIFEDGLYLYAIKLVDRLKHDDAERRAKADAALDFDTPADVPADPPRAGVRYRRRRGVQVA